MRRCLEECEFREEKIKVLEVGEVGVCVCVCRVCVRVCGVCV